MQKIFGALTAMLISTYLMAQDKAADIDVDINKDGDSGFITSPWMWVVGGALFILLLIALTRGGGSRKTTSDSGDRVTVTKTVERDSTTDL